jgi:hypothetical protein
MYILNVYERLYYMCTQGLLLTLKGLDIMVTLNIYFEYIKVLCKIFTKYIVAILQIYPSYLIILLKIITNGIYYYIILYLYFYSLLYNKLINL